MQNLNPNEIIRLEEMLRSPDPTIIELAGVILLSNYYNRDLERIFEKVWAESNLERWDESRRQPLAQIEFGYQLRRIETQLMWGKPKS